MLWLQIVTIAVLSFIVYEDFRYRLVRVILYVLVLGLLLVQQSVRINLDLLFLQWGVNIAYLLLIGSISLGYFYVKNRKMDFFKSIGIGDVMFLVAIASWFEPIGFVFFNTVSLALAAILHFVFRRIPRYYSTCDSVPLAGMQSLCFIPVFLFLNN